MKTVYSLYSILVWSVYCNEKPIPKLKETLLKPKKHIDQNYLKYARF